MGSPSSLIPFFMFVGIIMDFATKILNPMGQAWQHPQGLGCGSTTRSVITEYSGLMWGSLVSIGIAADVVMNCSDGEMHMPA